MRSSRKRKRESPEIAVPKVDHHSEGTPPTEKELDVWEAFREEYVESVEQLPLSIHRNFSLMNEIDSQAHLLQASLPTNVREYIRERQSLKAAHGSIQQNSRQDAMPHSPFGPHGIGEAPSCTGKMLSSISLRVIELLRAAEEKVNLAQASYDSIDRHVRLLDQTIKEHELESKKEISAIEAHPNLVLTTSSISARRGSSDNSQMSTRLDGRRGADRNVRVRDAGRTRRALRGRSPISIVSASPSGHDPNNNRQAARRARDRSSVDATRENTLQRDTGSHGPGSMVVLSAGDMPIDPNEPRYCYCGQVSWGVMIACDAGGCEGEWFHLGCVGLTKAPERGKWYCDVCKEKNMLGRRRRGQRSPYRLVAAVTA